MKLKILFSTAYRFYYPNSKSEFGGTDVEQIMAFKHIFNNSVIVDEFVFDSYYPLIHMHGWKCEITKVKGPLE